jgi:hypothetical protein
MLVSHLKKFIFIKTIKTASTSVEMYFQRWCLHDPTQFVDEVTDEIISTAGIIGYRGWNHREHQWYNHITASQLKELVGAETWKNYYKFTTVRNPYERAVSLFYWLVAHNRITCPSVDTKQRFVWFLKRSNEFASDTVRYVIDNEYCHDGIIRYEHLHDDTEKICQRLGVEWNPQWLGKYKSDARPSYATIESILNSESIEFINRSCEFEFKYFDYKFL